MGVAKTNLVTLFYGIEPSLAADPTAWKSVEPNEINTFGATISKVARNPINPNRQNQKSSITDLDSAVELGSDLTIDAFNDFAEGFVFANYTATGLLREEVPTDVTTTGFTVVSGGDIDADVIFVTRGFVNAENNGRFLSTVVASPNVATEFEADSQGTVVEAVSGYDVLLEVAGIRGASGDITVDASGNLTSTVLDFTTLGLTAGQMIHVGGDDTDSANELCYGC